MDPSFPRHGSTAEDNGNDSVVTLPPSDDMDQLLSVLSRRVSGRATNEQVESVVQHLLQQAGVTSIPKRQPPTPQPDIEVDEENYDDDTDPATSSDRKRPVDDAIYTTSADPVSVPSSDNGTTPTGRKKRKYTRRKPTKSSKAITIDWSIYTSIPLGKQGAQMMTNFGDGPRPNPSAVQATLEGARRMLQRMVLQDARHLRRRKKQIYLQVRDQMYKHYAKGRSKTNVMTTTSIASKTSSPAHPTATSGHCIKQEWSSELMYRAMQGYDPLSYDPKCGLDVEELRQLFPEEMNAFRRWSENYSASIENDDDADADDDIGKKEKSGDEINDEAEKDAEKIEETPLDPSGHLFERMVGFDVRTDRMKQDWYLKFADIRHQGSFLSRGGGKKGTDSKWDRDPSRRRKQGEKGGGNWAHMSASVVRFLHWVGFDPQSALPPPNDDTTQALAFLAHDFVGRIVETAIFLRKQTQHDKLMAAKDDADVIILPQLDEGEQLEKVDIAKAMKAINPMPLYGGTSDGKTKQVEPQLYFGPGFEDRLEMELEEMMAGQGDISEHEMKIRREEDKLFEKLAEPPSILSIERVLGKSKETAVKDRVAKGKSKDVPSQERGSKGAVKEVANKEKSNGKGRIKEVTKEKSKNDGAEELPNMERSKAGSAKEIAAKANRRSSRQRK